MVIDWGVGGCCVVGEFVVWLLCGGGLFCSFVVYLLWWVVDGVCVVEFVGECG